MTTPIFRTIARPDLPELLRLLTALAAHHGDRADSSVARLARDVLGPAPWLHVIVAERGGALIGYAALCPLAQMQFGQRGVDLHHLFVDAQWRGTGAGRGLIDAALAKAKSLGASYVRVATTPDNRAAQVFYEGCGFTRRPEGGPRFGLSLA